MTPIIFNIKILGNSKRIVTKFIFLIWFMILAICSNAQTTGEWTWMNGTNTLNYLGNYGTKGVASITNKPPGVYEACEWTDKSGNFWFYGGENNGWYDNLWKYNVATNMWTWVKGSGAVYDKQPIYGIQGLSNINNSPGERMTSQSWTDTNGNLWLYGGISKYTPGGGEPYSDLWKYEISTNIWTWMKGDSTWTGTASYGNIGVENSSNKPPPSNEVNLTWTDNQNNLWLVDNQGCLWKYKVVTNNWIWMKGDTTGKPTFGSKGIANINNTPGSLYFSFTRWKDSKDNFWLLYNVQGGFNNSVLFKYEVVTNMWTWMWGDTTQNAQNTHYSDSLCDYKKTTIPYIREEGRACWIDNCDNLWLIGGYGCSSSLCGDLNDLIYFDTHVSKWIRAGNDTTFYSPSVFGVMGVSSSLNKPASRAGALPFKDINGNLWLYAGLNDNTYKYFADLWKFTMDAGCPPCATPYTIGIEENELSKNDITLYPNPFTNNTTLKANHYMNNATLIIYNSIGQKIKQIDNISGENFTLFRDNMANGLYFLTLTENKINYTSKVLMLDLN